MKLAKYILFFALTTQASTTFSGLREDPRQMPLRPAPQSLITKEYLPTGAIKEEIANKSRAEVKAFLEQHGISFPPGGKVLYLIKSNRLIIRNTNAAHIAVEALLSN